MKKLLLILFLLPILSIGQNISFNDNKLKVTSVGDLTYTLPYCEGNADSITYTVTVGTQHQYYKINSGSVNWRVTDGYTCQGDSVQVPITGTYKIESAVGTPTFLMKYKWYDVTGSTQIG